MDVEEVREGVRGCGTVGGGGGGAEGVRCSAEFELVQGISLAP